MNIIRKRISIHLAVVSIATLLPTMMVAASDVKARPNEDSLVIGGGCFWCLEALFESLDGVHAVESGYAGGNAPDPSYKEVCSGRTGHAEVVKITFNPEKISLEDLLKFFWEAHDPTTLNRQGADVGSQYRSIILYRSEEQKSVAAKSLKEAQKKFSRPIVTEITKLERFFPAENYHQDYFKNNLNAPYCQYVIAPKLRKLES